MSDRSAPPRRRLHDKAMLALNTFGALFSLIWLIGHVTERVGDWEFWFALGYLVYALANLHYLLRLRNDPLVDDDSR